MRKHVQSFMRGALDHGLLWWAPRRRLEKLIRIEGLEHWLAVKDQPVIWLAPHFMGLDAGGTRLAMDYPAVSMYGQQKNPCVMQLLLRSRTRFGTARLYSRQDGIKPVIKAIRKGLPFYYLPDQDFRRQRCGFRCHFRCLRRHRYRPVATGQGQPGENRPRD